MVAEAHDYRDECNALYALLAPLSDDAFSYRTLFKDWTINDVLGHLHMSDQAAVLTLDNENAYANYLTSVAKALASGVPLTTYTTQWLGGFTGHRLLQRWHELTGEVARRYAELDSSQRVAWVKARMSTRSCISARLMETWAHGQAVYDRLGRPRQEHDRIKSVAVLGVNTFGFSFANRNLEPPTEKPFVRLTAPSGAIWTWNAPEAQSCVEGSAVEFCQVVAQTRNVADTKLMVKGDAATRWMSIAQCFGGPPEEPPFPGARHLHTE
ncbi:TIGR03084 family metal-binding protein [Bradyrhizobium sp. 169]|uniref:TIGR03084 family metal-binding protein n=1 Tax=Bradyrhizobium sp. 169 TaxID=2782640 RepID=UPI001FFBB39E|nr:TIGR03084 family metal-binding protein [Bradyrhizobium sp. 169]MCK1589106.1 TIGR03084 family protein [Bradyrhizobium sp. 169]